MTEPGAILVVDDLPQNVRLLEAILTPRGHRVHTATSGPEALERLASDPIDLVLLDIVMPGMDGYATCRAIRESPATRFLPVVMITASGDQEKVAAIEAGADDFVAKPFEQAELLARVGSLLRIKRYHDTIEAQAAELATWNRELEARVEAQVEELDRMGRLRRFLPPQVAELVLSAGDETVLRSHRREIVVVNCDLRGFTSFAETVEPEDVMHVLEQYHAAVGDLINRFEGTLERFTGDGVVVLFNDPMPCADAPQRAVRLAVAIQGRMERLAEDWQRRGYGVGLGIGIAQGHATLGRIGYEGRWDYAAIGSVTNLAARLCARAAPGQILISQRVHAGAADIVVADEIGELELRGFSRPTRAFSVAGLDEARARGMTQPAETAPRLSDLSEEQRNARFAALQERLPAVWRAMRLNHPGESIVVIPSVAPDGPHMSGAMLQGLEERLLFLLFLLRQPRLQIIYVTGRAIPESIVTYYLAILPGVIPHQARPRLHMVATNDGSPRPLAVKLLERPRLLTRLRALIPDPQLSHLVPYSTTILERDLALALGIPLFGADPRTLPFGTKTGCRRLFAEAGVRHPVGQEGVSDVGDVVDALTQMRAARPAMAEAIVKHNEGVAGRGNAVVDLRDLPLPGSPAERESLRRRVEDMALEHAGTRPAEYLARLARDGGIVEERVVGTEVRSPSVQLRVTPLGEVELLSTHDQVLGGPTGQRYEGCRFPADFGYARAITREAAKVGARLAEEGVLGRFAIDFVVVRDGQGPWEPYAIELNLRKGGTTHPFLTLQFLTDGRYDADTALFRSPSGREKHLVATDHLESELLRGLSTDDLFDIAVRHGLQFDHARQTGIVFHMMSGLAELGSVGLTAVGDGPEQADATFRRAERILLEEAAPPPEPPLPPVSAQPA